MKNIKKMGQKRRRLYQAVGRTYPTAGSRLRACQGKIFTLSSRGPLLPSQTFSTSGSQLAVLPSPPPSSRPPQILGTSRASATTAPLMNRKPTSTISWRRIPAFGSNLSPRCQPLCWFIWGAATILRSQRAGSASPPPLPPLLPATLSLRKARACWCCYRLYAVRRSTG